MIYLVTNEKTLFKSGKYQVISPEDAIKLLDKENLLGADSETAGFDPYTKPLLAFQLGTTEFQIVWDCVTVPITKLKPILENPAKTFIFWNANFDLQFLYHQRIIPSNVYDGFLAEKLLWLGYPAGMHGMSLKDACLHYCGVSLDKSVRGEIIEVGLTERTILYTTKNIKYEIPIYKAQQRALAEKDLLKAIELENKFIKIPPYISYCGMRLDVQKWKSKMRKDRDRLDKATTALNNWAVNYYLKHKDNGNTFCITDCILVREEKQGRMVECPKPSYKYVPIGPEKVNEDKYGKKGVYQEIRIDFPYIKIDLQGDLFSGFNTAPQCTINWSSSKQVIAFFELLGINVLTYNRKTHKETKSVEANVLKPQKNKFNIIPIYLDYKESAKVVEGYGENWLKAINPVTHRIHLRYNPIGTDTSRLSSGGGEEKLNAQNIPSDEETRACFIASNGYKWLSCDYSG